VFERTRPTYDRQYAQGSVNWGDWADLRVLSRRRGRSVPRL